MAAAAALPRLVVLLVERGDILVDYVDKSDTFAQTLVDHGTFGFIPGQPSAYTQPLYGHFLTGVYWVLGRDWWTTGAAQILVAVATACAVLAIGRRSLAPGAAVVAALLSTLHPYLVWHDIHLNREVLDGLVAALVVLLTLLALERLDLPRAAARVPWDFLLMLLAAPALARLVELGREKVVRP